MVITFVIFVAGTYLAGWMNGWWIGRNYMMRLRHGRADRIQALLNEKLEENATLLQRNEELFGQIRLSTDPIRPVTLDREVKRLGRQLRTLEERFWYKDQQLRDLDRKRMGLIRQIGRLSALFVEAKNVIGRARAEIHNHAHNHCAISRPLYIAARGRVWHYNDQCYQLSRSQVIEMHACEACASFYITPYLYNMNTRTSMANSISDEDPEVLAEASALIADKEARRHAAGGSSSAGVG